MTGAQFLDILCGSTTVEGLLDSNPSDAKFRATVLGWLNLVLKDIQNRQVNWHWRFLEKTATASTVANQHTYDSPTDIDTNKFFSLYERTNDITLKFIPYDKFVRMVADPSNNTGDAVYWTFWAKTIRLYPVPSSAYTIYLDYIKLITALTDSSTAPDVPAKYDPVIIDGILAIGYKFDPELGLWTTQQEAYEAGVQKMVKDNMQMIGELGESVSHRERYRSGKPDGQGLFPLDTTSGVM
jgi:hypothetical protein